MTLLGPHLQDLLLAFIDQSVPVLKIRKDQAQFYPGSAFSGLAVNAKHQVWRTRFLPGNSGTEWFSLFLDAIGIWWTVDYVIGSDGRALLTAGQHQFYWPHEAPGLALLVLRPLYIDWILGLALASEFGPEMLQGIAQDPILLEEYDEHLEQMECFLAHYQIARAAYDGAHPKKCSIVA